MDVVVIGAGASGLDISNQISHRANKVDTCIYIDILIFRIKKKKKIGV